MIQLFNQGGPIFMGLLTIVFFIMLALSVYRAMQIANKHIDHYTTFMYQLKKIKSVGLFALVLGIFAQLLGLYKGLSVMQSIGVSPALFAGGVKVSSIPTLYGFIIFLLAYLIWFGLDYAASVTATGE